MNTDPAAGESWALILVAFTLLCAFLGVAAETLWQAFSGLPT